ncbi:MAG: heme-copper oxidase subunit III [Verrucomicrobia bacterium]|nr:heme-copper oxidase subunit III [Verrucomicrobiota bacterium]
MSSAILPHSFSDSLAPSEPADQAHHGAPPYVCKLGMIVFLLSEGMLFAGLIGGYIVLRLGCAQWPPSPELPALPKVLTGCNTLILICSSLAFHMVEVSVKSGKTGRRWLFLTILLGSLFLGGQAYEWTHLYHEGLWFHLGGVYGSSFFVLTGFHGTHVFIGVLLMIWCFLRQVFFKSFTQHHHVALDNVGLYWHFVDVVWVFLYTVLYLI